MIVSGAALGLTVNTAVAATLALVLNPSTLGGAHANLGKEWAQADVINAGGRQYYDFCHILRTAEAAGGLHTSVRKQSTVNHQGRKTRALFLPSCNCTQSGKP
jgi:hypothetical protein